MAELTKKDHNAGAAHNSRADVVVSNVAAVIDDASPGSIPDYIAEFYGGHLSGVGVTFGAIPPNSLTVSVIDTYGVTIATGTVTATGRLDSFAPQPFTGNLTVRVTGNTVPNASATIALYAF